MIVAIRGAWSKWQCRQYAVGRQKTKPKPNPKAVRPPLAVKKPLEGWEVSDDEQAKKSKNQTKREALRSIIWAKRMASLTTPQIKNAIKWACLPDEVLEQTLILQKMIAENVRSAKRRQYNYLGGLLRNAEADLVELVLRGLQDGNSQAARKAAPPNLSDAGESGLPTTTVERWRKGLLQKDETITREVFSLVSSKEQLQRLVRDARLQLMLKEKSEESDPLYRNRCKSARQAVEELNSFLSDIAGEYSAQEEGAE